MPDLSSLVQTFPQTKQPAPIINLSKTRLDQLPKDTLKHRRLVILLLDLSSMPVEDQIQAQKAAQEFIEKQITPADLVAVMANASTLKMLQNFTNDRSALKHTVERLNVGDSASLAQPGTADPDTTETSSEGLSDAFVADENQTGKLSTFEQRLSVPDFSKQQFSMSSIILSNRLETIDQKSNAVKKLGSYGDAGRDLRNCPDPLVIDQNRIVPNVARVFSPTDTLYLFFQIYLPLSKASSPNLTASLIFFRDGERFLAAAKVQLTDYDEGSQQTVTCNFSLPLSRFPKGHYVLQINAIDQVSQESLIQRIHFVVR